MRLLVAPDKFRGTASAVDVVVAVTEAAAALGHTVDGCPLADGGEGTLDVLGGPNRTTLVSDPLGEPREAHWRISKGTAVIEMSRASGLALVGGAENNDAVAASTYGTGELIAAAAESGAKRIVITVGGSATTDGGLGALRAMLPIGRYRGIELIVACDVRTRFLDAAPVFAPQKGATPAQVELLRRRLERLADVYAEEHGRDIRDLPRSGAAGGLAGGLAAIGAQLVDGFNLVADEVGLDERIEAADAVVTGEGELDAESFDGKVVGGVIERARALDRPVLVVVGRVDHELGPIDVGESVTIVSLADRYGEKRAMNATAECIRAAVTDWLGEHS